jgi:hypothetical protein
MAQISAASFQSGYANYFSAPITIATFSFSNHQVLADLTSLTIQLRIIDGDTSPGNFDYNNLYLALEGINTDICLNGFSDGFDVTLAFNGTPSNAAAILSSLKSDGVLIASVIDKSYYDNYITFPSIFNASLVLVGTASVSAPSLALAADTGSSNSDGITNNGTVNVTGLEAGATWQYSTNGGSSWTNGTGTSFVLSSGTYSAGSVLVRQSDIAGNTSANGQLGAVIVDVTTPAAGTLAFGADFTDSGSSPTDRITNDRNFSLSLSGQEAGSTVIYQLSNNIGSTWTTTSASQSNLAYGSYQFRAIVTDVAGNTAYTTGQSVTIDTIRPRGSLGTYATSPAYAAPITNPFGIPDVGNFASAAFIDIDADDDLDLFLGIDNGNTLFYLNSAPAASTAPAYEQPITNPFGITDVGINASPRLGDIDADGDLDLIIGNSYSKPFFYRNNATAGATAPSYGSLGYDPGVIFHGSDASPCLVEIDIDADGDLDMFVGSYAGDTIFYRNIASSGATNPVYSYDANNPFGITNVGSYASHAFADVDADGDLDIFIGNGFGNTLFFRNTAGAGATTPAYMAPITNPFGIANVGSWARPSLGDIDADGDLDLFIANRDGNIVFFRNTAATPVAPVASSIANGSYGIGAVITLTVQFSEAVVVNTTGGTPMLQMETGATDRYALYSSGSTTNTLTFTYTVQAGDTSSDLDQLSANALTLNGGTITDVTGNNTILTLAVPGATGSLGANAALLIDGMAPTAPGLALASDSGMSNSDGNSSTGTVNVSGLETGASWQYSVNGGISWLAGTGNSFSVAPGTYGAGSILVRQSDIAGNISANGQLSAVTIDTSAAAPTLALASDTGISNSDGITNNGTVNVTGLETGATWQYSINGGSSWTNGTGTSFVLSSGTYSAGSVLVRQSDIAGNTSANGQLSAVTIDTSAAAPTLALASDTGISNSDGITNNGTVNVTGLETGATWQYSTNGGSSWTNGTGTSFVLSSGTYSPGNILVRQSDLAGNTSANGQLGAVTIDTSAAAPSLALAADTGSSSSDGITNNGTVNVTGLETGASWQYSTNGGGSWTNGTGTSFVLSSGTYSAGSVLVRQSDIAGNTSANGQLAAITIDTSAPLASAVVITGTGISVGNGNLNAGKVVTITVTMSELVTISGGIPTLSLNSGGIATYASGSGTTSLTFSYIVAAGNNAIDLAIIGLNANGASIADAAGNSLISFSFNPAGTLVVDTTAPTGSLNNTAPVSSTTANGNYYTGAVINLAVQFSEAVFVNTTSGTPRLQLETGAIDRYAIYTSGSGTNTLSFSYTVQAGDSSADLDQVSSSALELNGGTIKDAAGNIAIFSLAEPGAVGSLAANAALVINGIALISPTLALAADTGSSNSDGITNNGTVNVSGLETGASWQYSTNGGGSWLAGTGTSFGLNSGSYGAGSIQVRQSDIAGNTSANGQLGAVTIDTTKPLTTAAITAVTDNVGFFQGAVDEFSGTDDATPIFGGTISAALSADETLAIYNRDSFLGNATVNNATKTWSFAPATLPNTTGVNYAITAWVTDVAGNYSQSPIRYFWLDTTASTTTTSITSVADNVGNIQGTLASGAVTDDITPTISGVLSAPLGTGETLRLYNGNKYLGLAIPADGVKTWSYTSYLADGFYSINARVVDAVGNIGTASATQNFSIDSTSNQLTGSASANTLAATGAKDLITGLGGADTFRFTSLTQSTLANFDRITDFTIGTDILDGPTALSAANINKLGTVAALDSQSISTILTSQSFLANKAATFSYADPSGISRSFIALNDGVAGFSASNDAIVEITGYIGSLNTLQII